jgi:hypothetical protein
MENSAADIFMVHRIDEYWDELKPLISKAIQNRRFTETETLDMIYLDLKCGIKQLWFGSDIVGYGVAITAIRQYPKVNILEVNYVAGERIRGFFLHFYEEVKSFGRENGCTILRGFGRIGWLRLIPDEVKTVIRWDVEL